jgi:dipeptidyl aminopeptidase/acylaminoacyl peptidase
VKKMMESISMRKILFKATVVAVVMSAVSLGAAANTFEIEHLPKVQHADNITVSNDGDVTAYTVSSPRDILAGDKDGIADTHLYIIRGTSDPIQFIGTEGSISALQISPDKSTLYFKSKRNDDKKSSLYSISLAGGEAQKRFEFETNIGDYRVSNDGSTLHFVATEKDEKEDFKEKGFDAFVYEEDQRLASLWSVSLKDKDAQAVKVFDGGHVSNFEVSANEKTLVAAVAPSNLVDDSLMFRDLFFLDIASGDVKSRIDIPGKLGSFELSDNGEHLAFLAGTDLHDTSTGVLMIAESNTDSFTQLTKDAPQHIMDIDWLGKDILAVAHRGVESALVVYETDGGEKRTLRTPSNIVVRSVDIGDGAIRFIADSAEHPREVFSIKRNKTKKLSSHNAWIEDLALAPQTTYTFTARDGRPIEGLLITPNGTAPAGGWPLILTVHGGPEAHYSDGWITRYSDGGQFAAADGYAVFYPNYRGSTGRGVAFAKEHQNDYAGKEFNDLVDGVNALVKDSIVNKDRVGITGGSYGGYASMWGATAQSEYFAAAVAFVGISNQISKFGTSDIPNEMHLVHSLKWPWDDNWMNLLERSPIFHAGKSTTPTLIMHGEKDTRVHPSQSMELYRAIKVRTQTPVRLVFYPGEGHGNRKAAAQYDYSLRFMRWMDTYLAQDATRMDPMPSTDLGLADKLDISEDESQ